MQKNDIYIFIIVMRSVIFYVFLLMLTPLDL